MISKSKARVIEIDDTRFRYKVSARPVSEGVYELNITIQSEDHNARKLLVTGIRQHDYSVKPPQTPDDHKYFLTIIRDDIDGFIREAIGLGWKYQTRGSDFCVESTNEPFRLIPYWEERPAEWFKGRHFQAKQDKG
tara:strand:+ start:235 stop:642 length:408 start_codon:yes stop_codon:yes gene_type:complete